MSRISTILAAVVLAGCSGSPFVFDDDEIGDGDGTTTGTEVPDALAGNLSAAAYDPAAQTLTISLQSLDATPVSAAYQRDAALDVEGFEAYSTQETTSQRKFVALFKQAESGSVQAGVVADGGQFVNFFSGGTFARMDTFTMPTSGLASYEGSYVGLLNTGAVQPGPGAPFDPAQSDRVVGQVFLNADFNDLSVNGGIRDRSVVETGVVFDDVFLEVTGISAEGAFEGVAKRDPTAAMGTYGGIFGGQDASDVAGLIVVTPVEGVPELIETGAFVLGMCGGGDASPCP